MGVMRYTDIEATVSYISELVDASKMAKFDLLRDRLKNEDFLLANEIVKRLLWALMDGLMWGNWPK